MNGALRLIGQGFPDAIRNTADHPLPSAGIELRNEKLASVLVRHFPSSASTTSRYRQLRLV